MNATARPQRQAGDGSARESRAGPVSVVHHFLWHAVPAAGVLAHLEATPDGLSTEAARRRLELYGANRLRVVPATAAWRVFVDQFRSLVVLLLAVAGGAAWFVGERIDSLVILAILAANALLGFATELRAHRAIEALRGLEVPLARVVRDGESQEIEAAGLVPGDLIEIEAGQAVPADARLLAASELAANEALLTGESLPVEKRADAVLSAATPVAERSNMLYQGTTVVAGEGQALVVATGDKTELGRIGVLSGTIATEPTPLERRLDALGRRLVWLTLGIAVVVIALGLARGESLMFMIETGIALAIAAVPEGLPAVATIALAVGVWRMARRKALVRRLPAVEALGSATVVCADKTGTLTAAQMVATTLVVGDNEISLPAGGKERRDAFAVTLGAGPRRALRIAALANRAALPADGNAVQGSDPTERALLVAAASAGIERARLREQWPEIGGIPFSSDRGWMATFHRAPDGTPLACVKGAPERVLERCDRRLGEHEEEDLDEAGRQRILEMNRHLATRGLRVLALAEGEREPSPASELVALTFVALVGIEDPVAAGVVETVHELRRAGIRTVMLTGDQRRTAEAVARSVGMLAAGDEIVHGPDLEAMSDAELERRMPAIAVVDRISPVEKLRVVEALQKRGEIVAMLGDGVNDAVALKRADIGVAMGRRGTDVARDAAAIVLRDDRFATVAAAVEEGRVIFENIRKFVYFLFSCNLAEVLVLLGASVIALPQPLLPLQILWMNLVTDSFPALALAVEPGEPGVMSRPPRDPGHAILSPRFLRSIVFFAVLITLATLAGFLLALNGSTIRRAQTVTFMTLALAQVFHLGNARSHRSLLHRGRTAANPWALAAVLFVIALQLAAVYWKPLAEILGVVAPSARDWSVILPLALAPAVIGQGLRIARERPSRPATERRGEAQ